MKKEIYEVHVFENSTKYWFQNGQLHRLDGPAVECANGTKYWFQNGFRHRLDGPAIEQLDGSKFWYQNGQLHRLDGPAVECANGTKYWFINDKEYTEEEFKGVTSPAKELTVAEISKLLGYEVKVVKG